MFLIFVEELSTFHLEYDFSCGFISYSRYNCSKYLLNPLSHERMLNFACFCYNYSQYINYCSSSIHHIYLVYGPRIWSFHVAFSAIILLRKIPDLCKVVWLLWKEDLAYQSFFFALTNITHIFQKENTAVYGRCLLEKDLKLTLNWALFTLHYSVNKLQKPFNFPQAA